MKHSNSTIHKDNYSLMVCERRSDKINLLCWTQTKKAENMKQPVTVCFVEHPIYVSEWCESHQKQATPISINDIEIIREADYDDFEKYLIININSLLINQHQL